MPAISSPYLVKTVKVMLVDDSAIIRGLIARILAEDSAIEVIAQASNGESALAELSRLVPDVIILDIEMPVMDGLTALPAILHGLHARGYKAVSLPELFRAAGYR